MKCEICDGSTVKELSMGDSKGQHYYCPACKGHLFRGKWISRKEWERWIEGKENDR